MHTHTQNTTHTQQQNEPLPPYPPADSPSLAIATPVMTSNQDTSAPCGSVAGALRRVHACLNLFLCLGHQHISKNRAMGVDLAFLTRCQSRSKNNNCSYYSNILSLRNNIFFFFLFLSFFDKIIIFRASLIF